MKFKKTYKFAFYTALLLVITSVGLALILHLFLTLKNFYFLLVIFTVLFFSISFLLIQYRVEFFIYKRIQKIYNDVSILEVDELDKSNITTNMETLSKKVKLFADKKLSEIEILKEREIYRREYLGNISHELKTPLFTVQGYILTLLEGAINDKNIRTKYLERANNGVERLNHIVKDLDMISKLETGDLNLTYQNFNIITLVENVYELLDIEAKKRNISLLFFQVYETPILVNADKERIQQVLINLIANAIYYGKNNGTVTVKINFYQKNKVLIAVSDTGFGIEKGKLPRLFERFYRVDKSRARNQGGTGLGLSIVKHILEAHNETIFVTSELHKGSSFSFTLVFVD